MPTDAIQMSQQRHLSKVCDPCQSHTSLNNGAHKHGKANLKQKVNTFLGRFKSFRGMLHNKRCYSPGFPAVSVFTEFRPPPHLSAAAHNLHLL